MDSNQMALYLELAPLPEMIRFFQRKKTAISFNIHKPLIFLHQLQDHGLITEDLCQEVLKARSKDKKQKGLHDILTYVEKQGEKSIKQFWICVFEDHMLKKYPFLCSLLSNLQFAIFVEEPIRFRGQLPDAKKLTGSGEKVAGQTKSRNKRKKGIDETEARFSHSLKRAKKEDNSKLDCYTKKHSFTLHEDREGTLHQDKLARGSCSRHIRKVKEGKPLKQKKGKIKSEKTTDVTEDKRTILFHVSSSGADRPSMQNTAQPIKREKKEDIWALDKTLPVTCGDKAGRLYPDKLARGEKCILSQDHWFTPNAFETFSGRGNCKKWKDSIYSQNTPLQKLLKEGHLQCPRTYRRYGQKKKAVSCVENSSSDLKKWIKEENNEQEEDGANDGEPVDLPKFDAPALPVSCGSVSGILYKSRFVGSRSKSIRTEERWFSPEEFVKQDLTLTDRHWRKDILCHGKTLNYLVKKKILYIHSLLCSCDLCSPNNQSELDNDDVCYICNTEGKLVCCDGCPRAFHPDCHLSALQEDTTVGKWLCTFCVLKANNELWTQMSLKAAVQSPVSENIMRCEYLLLNLYKEDTQQVFTDDPTSQVEKYSRVISNPMWLNRVKSKLHNKEYETMRQFLHDVLLIFKNCKKFNKDNKFGKLGDRLCKIFVQDFYTIFKIK